MKNLVASDTLEHESAARIKAEFSLMNSADCAVASSENDRQYLKYLYNMPPEKIRVIAPGIDTKLFYPVDRLVARKHIHADPAHKIILFVGRIEPLKGIDTLLYAMKILN